MNVLCPCHSGRIYSDCCQKYHLGTPPENALLLMRSRYAAYAMGLAEYVMETTHPQSDCYQSNKTLWKEQILAFSNHTSFDFLEIIEFVENENEATVTFYAHLTHNHRDSSFREKSYFKKLGHQWKYFLGEITRN